MEHKSEQIVSVAQENGWKAQCQPVIPESKKWEEIVWNVFAIRGPESLHVVYTGDRMTEATYTYGDQYKSHPARKGAVVDILKGAGTPPKQPRRIGPVTDEQVAELRSVPFEIDTPAIDIMRHVMKKQVFWISKLTGRMMCASVNVDLKDPISARHFRVYDAPSGRRLLEWVDPYGFHAVALEQIINVA